MPDQAVFPPADTAPALSQWQRFVDAFIAPGKTFTDIRRSTSWWLPWLVSAILSLVFMVAVQQQVGWSQVFQNILRQNPQTMAKLQTLPADQVAAQISVGSKIVQVFAYAVPLELLLFALIGAAILWGTVNWVFGGHARFGQMYAVWFYGCLPLIFTSILAVITLYSGLDTSSFNLNNAVGTNIGYYLPNDSPHWLVVLLTSVDILKIWAAVLLTIGCATVGQIKKSSAAIAVFGWWIIIILVSTGKALL